MRRSTIKCKSFGGKLSERLIDFAAVVVVVSVFLTYLHCDVFTESHFTDIQITNSLTYTILLRKRNTYTEIYFYMDITPQQESESEMEIMSFGARR